jgi:hypothetical protein
MKKPTRGGPGRGQGRKKGYKKPKSKLAEKTKVRRVPLGILEAVDDLIDRYKKSKKDASTRQ